ncbi:MAG: EthD domain-containing protein [Spongiibacteraceae bacterium]
MYKVVGLLKKHPDLSTEAFRDYYESYHRVIGEKYLHQYASRYIRRYLNPFSDPISGQSGEHYYDVVLEIWYHDETAFQSANELFSQPDIAKEIAEDEEKLFDRGSNRFYTVSEVESNLLTEE